MNYKIKRVHIRILAAFAAASVLGVLITANFGYKKSSVRNALSPLAYLQGGAISEDQRALIAENSHELVVCRFGPLITANFVRLADSFILALNSSLTKLSIRSSFAENISECAEGTTLFVYLVDGRVSRSGLKTQYESFKSIIGVEFDTSNPALYTSAFGQVFSVSVRQESRLETYGLMLINQNSAQWDQGYSDYVRGIVAEEWVQYLIMSEDIEVQAFPNSIVEEQFIPTPQLWQGRFYLPEIDNLSKLNPTGLCALDLLILEEIYGETSSSTNSEIRSNFEGFDDLSKGGFLDIRCSSIPNNLQKLLSEG